jgi:hypothetical protein
MRAMPKRARLMAIIRRALSNGISPEIEPEEQRPKKKDDSEAKQDIRLDHIPIARTMQSRDDS